MGVLRLRTRMAFGAAWLLVAAWAGALAPGASGVTTGPKPDKEFATGWFIVSLREPLPAAASSIAWPLTTGSSRLDAALVMARVARIEYALPMAVASAAASAGGGGTADRGGGAPSSGDRALLGGGTASPMGSAPSGAAEGTAAERMAAYGFDRTYKIFVPEGSDIRGLVARFAALPEVKWAEPDYVGWGSSTFPNDPQFPNQFGLHNTGQTGGSADADIDAPEGWDISTGLPRVIIAVLDTGADFFHEDFAGKLLPGWDFANNDASPQDDHGHGSNTASIAAAASNNGVGVTGVCWNCLILPLKNLDSNSSGFYTWWADSLVYAADHGARVINMSEGGSGTSSLLHDAIRYAYNAGCVIPAAMMNNDLNAYYYPASWVEPIAVGATDNLDRRAAPFCWGGGSNFTTAIDMSAPGDLVEGAAWGGGYNYWCGTSQATPMVSGLAGLIESLYPSAGRDEVKHLLQAGADDRVGRPSEDGAGYDIYHGWGRINAQRSLAGTCASISLRATGPNSTRLLHSVANPLATSYDFVRGNLGAMTESATGVQIGTVVCLENDSADADTLGNEDLVMPAPGTGFFYLSRFKAADGKGSYGGSSKNRDRIPTAGDCAP